MIRAIIFDIGGVVTQGDFEALYRNFATRIGLDPAVVIEYHAKNLPSLLKGEIPLEKIWNYFQEKGGARNLDYSKVWLDEMLKVREVDPVMIKLLSRLRKNYKVGALTNVTESRHLMDESVHLYDNFDFRLLSFEEHMVKPEKEFYLKAVNEARVIPEEIIFVDDQEKCMPPARELGMSTILFKDSRQCIEDLEKLGVKL